MVKLLLKNGADVNARNKSHKTPLHKAAKAGHPKVIEILLKHGAKKDLKDDRGRTALQYATSTKHNDIEVASQLYQAFTYNVN